MSDPGKYVQTWVSSRLWKRATLAARSNGVSLSRWVHDAILAALKTRDAA